MLLWALMAVVQSRPVIALSDRGQDGFAVTDFGLAQNLVPLGNQSPDAAAEPPAS